MTRLRHLRLGGSSPDGALAEGLAGFVQRWAAQAGATPRQAQAAGAAARAVAQALAEGHACVELADLAAELETEQAAGHEGGPADAASWRQALLASGVVAQVGDDGAVLPGSARSAPLTLDSQGRLALHRLHQAEVRLAARIAQRLVRDARDPWPEPVGHADAEPDWQRIAVAMGLKQRLLVVSGGPGTGKTTTVATLLAELLAVQPGLRVALVAPTGKAAARLAQSVAARAEGLAPELRERMPRQAQTVHRLIGARPEGPDAFHPGRPLALDLVVVDEASMLDLDLAARLFDALPDTARVVLLGDQDQLAAVEAGAVFAELSACPQLSEAAQRYLLPAQAAVPSQSPDHSPPPQSPHSSDPLLSPEPSSAGRVDMPPGRGPGLGEDHTVWLQRPYRFNAGSAIAELAGRVRDGQAAEVLSRLKAQGLQGAGVAWIDDGGKTPASVTLNRLRQGFADYAEALRRDARDHAAVFAAWQRFRVLCAVREGPRGVGAVNEALLGWLRRQLDGTPWAAGWGGAWCAGRPVMVLRNDAPLGLSNGDVGLALPDGDGWSVVFDASEPAGEGASSPGGTGIADGTRGSGSVHRESGALRCVSPGRLPAHETAFAMTVHKAQGSEWDEVLLLLAADEARPPTRELLYTGLTRARSQVTLAAGAAAVAQCVRTPTRRRGALAARVGAMLAGGLAEAGA